jgi:hypothetical protein
MPTAYPPVMTIKARLKGSTMDLEILEILFPGDPGIAVDHDGHYFWGSLIEDAAEAGEHLPNIAQPWLTHMQGIAKIKSPTFRGVEIERWDGHKVGSVLRILGASAVAWDKNGAHGLDPVQAKRWLDLQNDHRVARVLRLHAGLDSSPSWFDMYKIVETIRWDVKYKRMKQWVGKDALSTFNESANRAEISGTGARHAESPGGGKPSGRSMNPAQAREFVRALTGHWLAEKCDARAETRQPTDRS